MKIALVILIAWAAAGIIQLLLIAAGKWIAWRDLQAAPAAGFITIGGKSYKVVPLTMKRMDELLTLLTRGLDPAKPYTVERTAETMVKVLRLAAPKAPARALRAAPGVELVRAFNHVLNLYKLGSK